MSVALFYRSYCSLFAACLLGGLGLLGGCIPAPLPLTEYQAYLADPAHGLTHTVKDHGTTLTCAYRPTDLLVQQDLSSTGTASPDSVARAYDGKTYCTLTFSRNGSEIENQFVNDLLAYQQVLTYLNTGISADAFLATTPRDSVPAVASMYVRQYGTTGHSTVLLVFDTHQLALQHGFFLTLRGQRLGLGTLRFSFTGDALAALPAVKFN